MRNFVERDYLVNTATRSNHGPTRLAEAATCSFCGKGFGSDVRYVCQTWRTPTMPGSALEYFPVECHAARLRLALENRLRLDLQALGLKPTAPPQESLSEYLARAAAARASEAAE